jgi:hypothetical protein
MPEEKEKHHMASLNVKCDLEEHGVSAKMLFLLYYLIIFT